MVLCGADVGSTLIIQLLSFKITTHALALIGLGAVVALFTHRTAFRRSGRALFAFGLIILGLAIIQTAGLFIAGSPTTKAILHTLEDAPFVLALIGALLAVILNSITATIGLVFTLAVSNGVAATSAGALSPVAMLALTLGANVGITLIPLLASFSKGVLAERHLALAHSSTRLLGATVSLLLAGPITALLSQIWAEAGMQVAMAHLLFNLVLGLSSFVFAGPLANLIERLLPAEEQESAVDAVSYILDPRALADPAIAQGLATREALRMAEMVADMLHLSMQVFEEQPDVIETRMEAMDKQVDEMNADIKDYLTRLDEEVMSEEQAKQNVALFYIISDLEAIGDVITKRFTNLAHRRLRDQIYFSEEGWEDLLSYHERILGAFQEILAALATQNKSLSAVLLARKEDLNRFKRELHMKHIRQLRAGIPNSTASSAIYLDLLDAMSTILSHISNIAHALQGEIDEVNPQNVFTGPMLTLRAKPIKKETPARWQEETTERGFNLTEWHKEAAELSVEAARLSSSQLQEAAKSRDLSVHPSPPKSCRFCHGKRWHWSIMAGGYVCDNCWCLAD